jgi:predicted phosphodiesterase
MRIAILADIHGNLPAFEAALEHVARQHVDQIIIAGDIVNGSPDSAACWQLALSLGCPMLRGNHERYVYHYGTPHADPLWTTQQFALVRWIAAQFLPEERQAMEQLPAAIRLPDVPDLVVVHASLRHDKDSVAPYTSDEDLAAMFPDAPERLIVRAHNHLPQIRLWGEKMIVTSSSVGLPLDGNPTAQYVLLERCGDRWDIRHQSVRYDLDAAVKRFYDNGFLDDVGPMGRILLREVATASPQFVPFLRAYHRWAEHEAVPLAAAVDRFLTMH